MPTIDLTSSKFVAGLPQIGGKQTLYFDTHTRGLVLLVSKNTKSFRAVYYVNRKTRMIKLGRFQLPDEVPREKGKRQPRKEQLNTKDVGDLSIIDPTRQLDLEQARHSVKLFLRDTDAALSRPTEKLFSEVMQNFIEQWVERKNLRSAGTIKRILERVNEKHRWRDLKFSAISREHVNDLLNKVMKETKKRTRGKSSGERQADVVLAVIRKLMRWHATKVTGYVVPIVPGMNQSSTTEQARDRILDDDEIRALWKATSDCEPVVGSPNQVTINRYAALVRFLLLTLQRREKVAQILLADDDRAGDIKDGVWKIRTAKKEKGNASELVLQPMALKIITDLTKHRMANNQHAFAASSGPKAINAWSQRKTELDEKLREILPDMPHWVLHDLRRTGRSLLSRAGVMPDIAERVLGHKIAGVAGTYDRYDYTRERADALAKLEGLLNTILNPTANVVPLRDRRAKP